MAAAIDLAAPTSCLSGTHPIPVIAWATGRRSRGTAAIGGKRSLAMAPIIGRTV